MYATDTSNNVKQNSTLITVADVTKPVVNTSFNVTSPVINDVINNHWLFISTGAGGGRGGS